MSISFPETNGNPERTPLPQEFVLWLRSPAGISALETAKIEARSSVQRLTEERRIQPEQLHVPIVL